MIRLALGFFLALLSWAPAWGAFAVASAPSAWGGTAGAWTYGGSAAANAPWVSGTAAGGASVNVGGRAVTMPLTMRLAANAPQFIARAALLTPVGRTAAFIAWAAVAGWVWSEADGWWTVPSGSDAFANESAYLWHAHQYSGQFELTSTSLAGAFQLGRDWEIANGVCVPPGCVRELVDPGNCDELALSGPGTCIANIRQSTNGGASWDYGGYSFGSATNPNPPTYGSHPAAQADADDLAVAFPMPDAVPQEADDIIPLPVLDPELDPVRVPLGAPVPVANTDPQEYDQPVADIRPAPSSDEPFRVDVQPRTVTGTDPTGLTDSDELDGSEAPSDPASAPTLCEVNPNASACAPLGTAPPGGVIPTWNVPLSFESPVAFGPSDAACPPPRQMVTALAGTLNFDYTGACMFADGVRPIVIAMAYLASVFAFFGIGGRD